jgi:hypothetical protein
MQVFVNKIVRLFHALFAALIRMHERLRAHKFYDVV